MNRLFRLSALAAVLVAGIAAAALISAPSASAWDLGSLPPGFAYDDVVYDMSTGIYSYEVVYKPNGVLVDVTHIVYGTAQYPAAPTDPNFQANLDAFVNAHYTAPTTTSAPTTTAAATTTAATTTQAAPTTTAAAAAPVAPSATTTDTQTVAITTTVADPTLVDRVTALESEYAALAARVDAIQQANQAAWTTFSDDLAAGMDTASAALDARSSGMNALYELA